MSQAKLQRIVDIFDAMEADLDSAVYNILIIGGERAAEGGRRRVRIDTATLHDNIRVETVSVKPPHVQVIAGGQGVNPRTGRVVDYAAALEAKYPYMRPSVDETIPVVSRALENLRVIYQERLDSA